MIKKSNLPSYYSKIFFLRSEMDRLLMLSMFFSCMLVLARITYTGKLTFIFLVWNLILAFVPFFITQLLTRKPQWVENKIKFLCCFLVWLVFVPNSFYILTDLYHLGDNYNDFRVPDWFDLTMILSLAWNGLLLGVLSVRQMEKIVQQHFFKKHTLLFIYPIMWLNALGVYIGRYLRYNSWDVLTDPFQLMRGIADILFHPLAYRFASGMIFCFSVLLTIFYFTLRRISKTIR
jgi:uncharacterized membrane protein